MKLLPTLFCSFFIFLNSYAQTSNRIVITSKLSYENFEWEQETRDSLIVMSLMVFYDPSDSMVDSGHPINLFVVKSKESYRPKNVYFAMPATAKHNQGISIIFKSFIKVKDLKNTSKLNIPFLHCDEECCFTNKEEEYNNGYIVLSDKRKVDIFQMFLDYEYIEIQFTFQNGISEKIVIPLNNFKKQYKKL